jgi:hypothetical protein
MPVTLGDKPCLDPRVLARSCASRGMSTTWAALPNAYTCPLGCRPGEGWVLMALSDLSGLSADLTFPELYDLVFQAQTVGGAGDSQVTIKRLAVLGAECLTPGAAANEAAYLVRLADRRHFLSRRLIDVAYNLRHHFTRAYFGPTLRIPPPPPVSGDALPLPGQPWTWDYLVRDLWERATDLLGDYPGLPFTPLDYYQGDLASALEVVLGRLGCALALDPVRDTFAVVQGGGPAPAADAALAAAYPWRCWDNYPLRGDFAQGVKFCRVVFRRLPHVRALDGSPYLSFEFADDAAGAIAAVDPQSRVILIDDLEAQVDAYGAYVNFAECQTRAQERAADFFRRLRSSSARLRQVYAKLLDDRDLMPSAQIDSIAWRETAATVWPEGGMVTELQRHGPVERPGFPGVAIDPLTEVVRLTGRPSGLPGLLDGVVEYWDRNTLSWVPSRSVYVVDANDSGAGG